MKNNLIKWLPVVVCLVWNIQGYASDIMKEVPHLHVELITSPNIVNDGVTDNSFTIGVFSTNLAGEENVTLKQGQPVYFLFVLEDGAPTSAPTRPWGLSRKSYLDQAEVSLDNSYKDKFDISAEVTQPFAKRPDLSGWRLTPKGDIVIPPGDHFEFTVQGLKSNLPDGYTTPYFYYDDEDYHMFTKYGPILKSPIVSKQQNVGVGTGSPESKMHILGQSSTDVMLETKGGTDAWTIYRLKNTSSEWHIGTSKDWMNNILYFSESKIGKPGDVIMAMHPKGTIGMGVWPPPQDYRLSLASGSTGSLLLGYDLDLSAGKDYVLNLIKFGRYQDYQFFWKKSGGKFNKPHLGLNVGTESAVGFYTYTGTQSLLELDANTGDAYIKGKTSIEGNMASVGNGSEEVSVQLKGKGSNWVLQTQDENLKIEAAGQKTNLTLKKDGSLIVANNSGTPIWQMNSQGRIKLSNGYVPMIYKELKGRITSDNQIVKVDTGIGVSSYIPALSGIILGNYDMNEDGHHNFAIYFEGNSTTGNWDLHIQLNNHKMSNSPLPFQINVMAINRVLGQGF